MNLSNINAQADSAIIKVLNDNLKQVYHQGYLDGAKSAIFMTSEHIKKAAQAEDCPDSLKVGLNEAYVYLKAILENKPYALTSDNKKGALA